MLRSKRDESPRVVRLFKNGRSQALRIPKEFELDGESATIRRVGDQLIVEAITRTSLLDALKRLKSSRAALEITDAAPEAVDLGDDR
jgi:antitoxin VapB